MTGDVEVRERHVYDEMLQQEMVWTHHTQVADTPEDRRM